MSKKFKWIPSELHPTGTFWSLHAEDCQEYLTERGHPQYFGFVGSNVASKPGGVEQKYCKSMREAAEQVLKWAKAESGR